MNPPEQLPNPTEKLPYLLFTVGKNVYAINCEWVRSIETLGKVTEITGADSTVRGGVLYQNRFIHLIDMRRVFGLGSQMEEFDREVQPEQRIRDHERWVAELEASVHSHTEFTLTDDPHQCAFGRWFYAFHTENNVLKHQLGEIAAPHEAVHHTAKTVKELMQSGRYEQAEAVVAELKATQYRTTLNLLSSLRGIVADSIKELYIVLETDGCLRGVIVDTIVGVEYLEDTLQPSGALQVPAYVDDIRQRRGDERMIIVLNHSF